MSISTGKNTIPLNSDTTRYAVWCYGTRFIPSGIFLFIGHALTIAQLLKACSDEQEQQPLAANDEDILENEVMSANDTLVTATDGLVQIDSSSDPAVGGGGGGDSLSWNVMPQLFNFVSMFVYFTVVSMSFLSRNHQLWQQHPGNYQY